MFCLLYLSGEGEHMSERRTHVREGQHMYVKV